jgi:tripartite-type tricarboxylate transporter receptor subunit TctC
MVALAVSSSNHSFSLPGVQTLAEAGYPIPEYLVWDGLMAPAKTPAAIVTTLNDAIGKALVLPAIRNKLQRFGVEPRAMSPDEFAKFFAEDIAATTKLGKDANIQPLE